jgi:hypothetical protein
VKVNAQTVENANKPDLAKKGMRSDRSAESENHDTINTSPMEGLEDDAEAEFQLLSEYKYSARLVDGSLINLVGFEYDD